MIILKNKQCYNVNINNFIMVKFETKKKIYKNVFEIQETGKFQD